MSKIEWTERTWNPTKGCTKISPGCKNCYAETMAKRLKAMGQAAYQDVVDERGWTGKIALELQALKQPLSVKKPTMWFVDSMSDLFHEDVPEEFILQVFVAMALARHHTFQVLTKRAERMQKVLSDWWNRKSLLTGLRLGSAMTEGMKEMKWEYPLQNVWLGVSVENQKTADERIPLLLKTPAAVRFVSCEPMLEKVSMVNNQLSMLNWVIIGGESGHKPRAFNVDWAKDLIVECKAAGVPVFMKQVGKHPYSLRDRWSTRGGGVVVSPGDEWTFRKRLKDVKGGDMSEWDEELRVREMPKNIPLSPPSKGELLRVNCE